MHIAATRSALAAAMLCATVSAFAQDPAWTAEARSVAGAMTIRKPV